MKVSSTDDNLEIENRKAKVLSLHTRGSTQEEIAQQLGVSQQTVSRDLKDLRQESRKVIEEATRNAYFEYVRYFAANEQVTNALWEIVEQDHLPDPHLNSQIKDKIEALALIEQCQRNRLEAAVGGPASDMNALTYARSKSNLEAQVREYDERMENDDFFRAVQKGIIK